jgi:hypothetical protein
MVLGGFAIRWSSGLPQFLPLEQLGVATALSSGKGFSNPFWRTSGPTAWVAPAVPAIYAGAIVASKALGTSVFKVAVAFSILAIGSAAYLVLRFCIAGWRPPSKAMFCAAFAGYCVLSGDVLSCNGGLVAAEVALLLSGLAEAWRRPGSTSSSAMLFGANTLLALTQPGIAFAGLLAAVAVSAIVSRTPTGLHVGMLRTGILSAALAVLVGVVPWAVRNRVTFHHWIAVKSNGLFEFVLAQDQTENGILTDSSVFAGNPSMNPRVFAEYQRLGEGGFLNSYAQRAAQIVLEDPGRCAANSCNRLINILCYSKPVNDLEPVRVPIDRGQGARLVGQRILVFNMLDRPVFFWTPNGGSDTVKRARLAGAGASDPDSLLADWDRAEARIMERSKSPRTILEGLLWSGLPSLCCLGALFLARRSPPRIVVAAATVYLLSVVPYVLITHSIAYQHDFTILFALFAAGLVQATARGTAPLGCPRP